VRVTSEGNYDLLPAAAILNGSQLRVEERTGVIVVPAGDPLYFEHIIPFRSGTKFPNVGYWDRASESVTWRVAIAKPGVYRVAIITSAADGPSEVTVESSGGGSVNLSATATGNWDTYVVAASGGLKFSAAGTYRITVKPASAASWKPINLAGVLIQK
jgi:hypothetical protein